MKEYTILILLRHLIKFWKKVDLNGPVPPHRPELGQCHVWTGSKASFGYGEFLIHNVKTGAHRVAFLLANGRWPNPSALHKCDNPPCIRIDHLFEGTQQDNVADAVSKGRHSPPPDGWCDRPGEKNLMAKLTNQDVRDIRDLYSKGAQQKSLASKYDVSQTTINDIVHWRVYETAGGSEFGRHKFITGEHALENRILALLRASPDKQFTTYNVQDQLKGTDLGAVRTSLAKLVAKGLLSKRPNEHGHPRSRLYAAAAV